MDVNRFVFSHAFANEAYGTTTFYYVACISDILDNLEPTLRKAWSCLLGSSLAGISIEFPADRPEPRHSSVMVGLYITEDNGTKRIVELMDQTLCYEDIGKLIYLGFRELCGKRKGEHYGT